MSENPKGDAVRIFDFQDQPVRIIGKQEAPWFVAVDVCRVLDIGNSRDAVSVLDEDERDSVGIADAIGRDRDTTIISEAGLYSLIFRSRKPQAKEFKRWVTHEVLPAIRRTGRYEPGPVLPAAAPEAIESSAIEEPPLASTLHFLGQVDSQAWPMARREGFGNRCRLFAKAHGLAYREQRDPVWGSIRVYPLAMLRLIYREFVPSARLIAAGGIPNDDMMTVLAAAVATLETDAVIGLREITAAARELRKLADLIPAEGKVSLDNKKAIGARMARLRGKELHDGKGRRFAFFHTRVKTGVRYPIRFVPAEPTAEVAS